MNPNIGISKGSLKLSIKMLSEVLATEMVMYVKTRKAHWNVSGESFMELHKLFEAQYKDIEENIDAVAERIGKLGESPIGTMQEFLEESKVKEEPGTSKNSHTTIKDLLLGHETLSILLRKNIEELSDKNEDAATTDFFTGLLADHETVAWVLRRYLSN